MNSCVPLKLIQLGWNLLVGGAVSLSQRIGHAWAKLGEKAEPFLPFRRVGGEDEQFDGGTNQANALTDVSPQPPITASNGGGSDQFEAGPTQNSTPTADVPPQSLDPSTTFPRYSREELLAWADAPTLRILRTIYAIRPAEDVGGDRYATEELNVPGLPKRFGKEPKKNGRKPAKKKQKKADDTPTAVCTAQAKAQSPQKSQIKAPPRQTKTKKPIHEYLVLIRINNPQIISEIYKAFTPFIALNLDLKRCLSSMETLHVTLLRVRLRDTQQLNTWVIEKTAHHNR